MSDYRALVVEFKEETVSGEKSWVSLIIRTFDPEVVMRLLKDAQPEIPEMAATDTEMIDITYRYLATQTEAMLCTDCHRWNEQQEFTIDENDKQAKCPLCHTWIFIGECETMEL